MEFKKKVTFRGVDLLRFGLPSSIANNATQTPSNALYYQDGPSGTYIIYIISLSLSQADRLRALSHMYNMRVIGMFGWWQVSIM